MTRLFDFSDSEYDDDEALEILDFFYKAYHHRELDDSAKETFVPILKQYGFFGIVFVLNEITHSEEMDDRVNKTFNELWNAELGRSPAEDDYEKFSNYLRFFGDKGKLELSKMIKSVEEKRLEATRLNSEKDSQNAENILLPIIEDNDIPHSWQIYHEYGLALYHQKRFDEAIDPYKKAVLLNTNDDNWEWSCDDLKWVFFNAEKLSDGIDFFEEVIKIYPERWPAWHQLGWFYLKMAMYSESIGCYQKAIDLYGNNSNWSWSAIDLKECYVQAGMMQEGYEYFQAISNKYPKNWAIWHALAWFCWKHSANTVDAIKYYKKATETRPHLGWFWSWFEKGLCYIEIREREEAQECFIEALKDNPNGWQAYNQLAWGAFSFNQWEKSWDYIKHGLEINPITVELWLAIGDYFCNSNESNQFFAWLAYKRGNEINPNDQEIIGRLNSIDETYQSDLRKLLDQRFSIENDLRSACFDIGINFENVEGITLRSKVVSLLEMCNRYNRFDKLVTYILRERPDIIQEDLLKYLNLNN
jgi:tetratricopeptide (TPR) repeat protein